MTAPLLSIRDLVVTLNGVTPQKTLIDHVSVDLAQGDRQGFLVGGGLDDGADELDHVLRELQVVRVDLSGAPGREDHQGVLRIDVLEQVIDGRRGDANGLGDDS